MKKARRQGRAQGDSENRLSNDSNTTSPHAPQLFQAFFARRGPCRKCAAMVCAFHYFTSHGMGPAGAPFRSASATVPTVAARNLDGLTTVTFGWLACQRAVRRDHCRNR